MRAHRFIAVVLCLSTGCATHYVTPDEGEARGSAKVAGSCAVDEGDTCGGQSADGCWCDDACEGYGDCCLDKVDVCDIEPEPEPEPEPAAPSCMADDGGDYCGGQSVDGCWCDDGCEGYGDCCADVAATCDGDDDEPDPMDGCDGSATYTATFQADWDPTDVPNPHFSPLIGAVHGDALVVWTDGGFSSPGFEIMAETGGTSLLSSEIGDAVGAGTAAAVVQGGPIPLSPGAASVTFDVTGAHPRVTLVSMVAPSPDWFVGVDGLDLCGDDGRVSDLTVDLAVWDAGTDAGPDFTSPNDDENPAQPIALSDVFTTSAGTMMFTRQ